MAPWGLYIALAVVGIVIFVLAFAGFSGAIQFGQYLLGGFLIMLLVGVIIFAIYLFFRPKPVKISQKMLDDMHQSQEVSGSGVPAMTTGCWLRGDSHSSGSYLGQIVGHSTRRFKASRGEHRQVIVEGGTKLELDPKAVPVEVIRHNIQVQPPCLNVPLFKKASFPVVVMDFRKLDGNGGKAEWEMHHSPLNGDVVLFGNSLVKVERYFFLDTQADDNMIDTMLNVEALRTEQFLQMDNLHIVSDKAMAANPLHIQEMQMKKELGLPEKMAEMLDRRPIEDR